MFFQPQPDSESVGEVKYKKKKNFATTRVNDGELDDNREII